ncbi:MAG: efflux RND transporter periplasmic adaptor subunit [Granulosicoccus sp.]
MNRIINSSWKAAGVVVFVLAVWMLSGLFTTEDSANESNEEASANLPMTVEVTVAQSTLMARELNLQGQLNPIRQVLVKAQTSGEVQEIIKRKGVRVGVNDALVKLDEGGRGNLQAEAQAAVKTAESEQRAAQSMQRQRLQSQLQLEQANAVLEAARARLAMVELDIEYTIIKAPFAGVINQLPIERGALVERGDLIAELVDDSAFKVSAQVAQQALSQLTPGQSVTVDLITGETLSGALSFIGSVADPQTRSFDVEALVQNTSNTIAAGVSATLSIPVQEVQATFITPSALSLGDNGEIGVKALDDQDRVIFLPIELVSTTLDGAWVTGIEPDTRVITLGQGFVNSGEQVRAQAAEIN